MLKIGKFKYLFFITLIFTTGCANIHKDVFRKKPEKKETYKPPVEKEKVGKNYIIVKASEQEAWNAVLYSLDWIKWKSFNEDTQSGTIVLKEAYVFNDNNKFKRIYHWPPKDAAMQSDISDYLKKITDYRSGIPMSSISFTQENMRIKLIRSGTGRVKIIADYQIFPYTREFKLGDQQPTSYYIEEIIFSKVTEYLASN